jgi:hypothetical protein
MTICYRIWWLRDTRIRVGRPRRCCRRSTRSPT